MKISVALIGVFIALGLTQISQAAPFAPVPTSHSSLSTPVNADQFTFAVGGDNRSTGHGYPMPAPCAEICSEIGIIQPAFTLWTGDVIEGYGDSPAEANVEYDVFIKDLELTAGPVFNAPGNHEFSLDLSLLPVYKKRMGGSLYGSFDYGSSHFIALNTNAINADGTVTAGALDDEQWTWLENDLKASAGTKNIFVFMHHYLYGPPDPDTPTVRSGWKTPADRDRAHALFVKYGVRAVFCGHNHIYYHELKDGVDYFISGGSGAPLDASPDQGGLLHYLLVHVNGSKFTFDILQPWRLGLTMGKAENHDTTQTALVTNENHATVTVSGLVFHVKAKPGDPLAAVATVSYKGKKSKPADSSILSAKPVGHGWMEVVVQATARSARTTEVTVGPK